MDSHDTVGAVFWSALKWRQSLKNNYKYTKVYVQHNAWGFSHINFISANERCAAKALHIEKSCIKKSLSNDGFTY